MLVSGVGDWHLRAPLVDDVLRYIYNKLEAIRLSTLEYDSASARGGTCVLHMPLGRTCLGKAKLRRLT